MKKLLFLLVFATILVACDKEDDGIQLQLNIESCVLDYENNYAEVKIDRGEGYLTVSSSDSSVAEILYDKTEENIFYIAGHNKGNATVMVNVFDDKGKGYVKTVDVTVRETIVYKDVLTELYLKKGESRSFTLPFVFDKANSMIQDNSAIIDNDGVASVSAGVEMGNKFEVEAKAAGSTAFYIYPGNPGNTVLFAARIFVVDEYDLFIPESENSRLTFDLPFTDGVNSIFIWRGSGHYTAGVADKTVAELESITLMQKEDWVNEMNNSAVVRVTPLKSGKTKLIVNDEVTGQTHVVDIVVN
ncbi:MAG: hypothetical protein AB7D46_09030 [Flavobacteriaceae bacterium]